MILNVPNLLTLFRLLLAPVFIITALSGSATLQLIAALSFGIAALTDWFDGMIARRLNQVTEFGKNFDPVVDRILVISALVVLYVKISEVVPLWAVSIIIVRDLLVVIGGLYLASRGKRVDVIKEGKIATAVLMFSVFFLLLDFSAKTAPIGFLGLLLFYVGLLLSVASGLKYARLGATLLRGNHESR